MRRVLLATPVLLVFTIVIAPTTPVFANGVQPTGGRDGTAYDHADWGTTTLTCG